MSARSENPRALWRGVVNQTLQERLREPNGMADSALPPGERAEAADRIDALERAINYVLDADLSDRDSKIIRDLFGGKKLPPAPPSPPQRERIDDG